MRQIKRRKETERNREGGSKREMTVWENGRGRGMGVGACVS